MRRLQGFDESFLGERLSKNPGYNFLPHYLYFLSKIRRWKNAAQIQARILRAVPDESSDAWKAWIEFRSAQGEVTAIFFVENYLRGEVDHVEVSPPGHTKSCDLSARFISGATCYLEIKSQSGQQHGDRHPLAIGEREFAPQGEEDLRSWLFDEGRLSSRTGEPMIPQCIQASKKGADVLVAMTDIFHWKTEDFRSLGRFLVSDFQDESNVTYRRKFRRQLSCRNIIGWFQQRIGLKGDVLNVHILEAGSASSPKMGSLREVWLLKSSAPAEMTVIRSRGAQPVLQQTGLRN